MLFKDLVCFMVMNIILHDRKKVPNIGNISGFQIGAGGNKHIWNNLATFLKIEMFVICRSLLL
jgi:hypothetical protein